MDRLLNLQPAVLTVRLIYSDMLYKCAHMHTTQHIHVRTYSTTTTKYTLLYVIKYWFIN